MIKYLNIQPALLKLASLRKSEIYPFVFAMASVVLLSNILVLFPFNHLSIALHGDVVLLDNLTWGAFSYPIVFLVNDLTNLSLGKQRSRQVVYIGFTLAVLATLTTGLIFYENLSSFARIALASGTAFLASQLLDIEAFDLLRHKKWFLPPIASSFFGSAIDTMIFFSIAFSYTELPWLAMALDDFTVKLVYAIMLLLPYYFFRRRFLSYAD